MMINVTYFQLALAAIFVVVTLLIVRFRGISREREIIINSIRMTVQLTIAGYILGYVFSNQNPVYTIIIILLMTVFSIYNTFSRVKKPLSKELKGITALALSIAPVTVLCVFLFLIIRIRPWYNPQYFIPLAGMVFGNSMNGISLGLTRLIDGFMMSREKIEYAIFLGATPKKAAHSVVDNAFDAAIMPTINSMAGMGIISLPGMMTGQILAGNSPVDATKYQIAIMLAIMCSVALTVIILVEFGYRTFFNERGSLR